MSHHTLQKLMVRMLFDDALVTAIYQEPEQALAGIDLTEAECKQLLQVDRRAWRYDSLRQRRTLRTLIEEFKISTTIVLSATRSLASLEQFFASSFFHQAVQERGSLGLSFGEFLLDGCKTGNWIAPQIPDVVRMEMAIAKCRRALEREGEPESNELPSTISDQAVVKMTPGFGVGSYQANIVDAIHTVEQYLFEMSLMPAMALCDDAPRLPQLPAVEPKKKSYFLFSPGATGITLTNIGKASYLVLYEARRPIVIRSLFTRATAAGVNLPRTQEILAEWLEQQALLLEH